MTMNSEILKLLSQYGELSKDLYKIENLYDIDKDIEVEIEDSENKIEYDSKKMPIKVKDIEFIRKYVDGGKLKITELNAEYLLEQNPNIFQGLQIEIIDENDDDYFEVN